MYRRSAGPLLDDVSPNAYESPFIPIAGKHWLAIDRYWLILGVTQFSMVHMLGENKSSSIGN